MAGMVAGTGWGTADIERAAADTDLAAVDIFGTAAGRRESTAVVDTVAVVDNVAGSFPENEIAHWHRIPTMPKATRKRRSKSGHGKH